MAKAKTIEVKGTTISIIQKEKRDFISLTDMVKGFEDGGVLIEKWLRNKNTIEFIGIWEQINNPDFNSPEFGGIRNEAGLNRFTLSVKKWITKTNAVGLIAKTGRYGGTYAHRDIAFEFASSISPVYKLYFISGRLYVRVAELERSRTRRARTKKAQFTFVNEHFEDDRNDVIGLYRQTPIKEQQRHSLEWNLSRTLAKVNYRIHTDAIKEHLLPPKLQKQQIAYAY